MSDHDTAADALAHLTRHVGYLEQRPPEPGELEDLVEQLLDCIEVGFFAGEDALAAQELLRRLAAIRRATPTPTN